MDTIYRNAKGHLKPHGPDGIRMRGLNGPPKFCFRIFEHVSNVIYTYIYRARFGGSICMPTKYSAKVINAGERNVMELKQLD